MAKILIIDDERSICEILQMMLQQYNNKVDYVLTGEEAKACLTNEFYDVIISDIRLPDINGLELLEFAHKYSPESEVIMITAYASTESAIKALKFGAADYLVKPLDLEEVKITVDRCLEKKRLINENILLRQSIEAKFKLDNIVGNSAEMQKVFDLIKKVGPTNNTVLITGESGTGKDLIAHAIHHNSLRKNHPFVAINCGAMPETLLESELFGHVKGAFTGAFSNKKGLFEVANKGTIFLDEISEMSQMMQVKLLRVLQDKVIRRLGGTEEICIDVRVIAATNVNLAEAVKSARFREDLFYRLNVINIEIPPLRKRKDDILLLAYHFVRKYNQELGKKVDKISKESIRLLENYSWAGNVRELENAIARAVTLTSTDTIDVEHLPESILSIENPIVDLEVSDVDGNFNLENTINEIRRYYIVKALKKTAGKQKSAAQLLRITPRSLRYYIKKLKIEISNSI